MLLQILGGVTPHTVHLEPKQEDTWHGLADFPRPVHRRIPNFKGSCQACCSIKELDVFNRAHEVKVDPDKPLEGVRLAALQVTHLCTPEEESGTAEQRSAAARGRHLPCLWQELYRS
uniref:Uncharacterized protein n=1 Tax=Strix occidentalis caurina TaxID=311401 RepID=A0A8D0FIA0_STROC